MRPIIIIFNGFYIHIFYLFIYSKGSTQDPSFPTERGITKIKKTKKTKKTKKPKNKKKHQKKTKKPNKNVEGVGEEAKSRSECLTEPERSQKEKLLTKIWNEQ